MFISSRLTRLPIEEGILPLKLLSLNSIHVSAVRYPIDEGRVPVNLSLYKSIFVTRFSVTVIPYQVLTGCVVSQLACRYHPGPLVLSYRSTRAKESFTSTA